MNDRFDSRLFNEMAASCHLVDAAEDWDSIADNPTLPWPVRKDAEENSRAIFAELMMKRGKR